MIFHLLRIFFLFTCFLIINTGCFAADLPRLYRSDIMYEGAFRLPASTFGTSSLNYSQGPIEYNRDNNSIFIVGHAHHQQIAEFQVPGLSKDSNLGNLPIAGAPLQSFTTILDRTTNGNPQSLDRIGGMEYVYTDSGGQLIINAYEYYDAPGNNSQTTSVARNSNILESCTIDGYYTFAGGAGHTSGWISPIPAEWRSALGGDSLTGQSSGIPIISRTSVGPSAFSFNTNTFFTGSTPTPVPTTKLLDFSLRNPLHDDLSNDSRNNSLWTHLSRVVFGLIVPGTSTYLTVGHSGGHESGVCYKCTQNNGNLCGGYCAHDADDYYHYYWLWDVEDLIAVKNGTLNSYDVRPYAYGEFPTPFATQRFGGGTFDPASGLMYLSVQKADRLQGTYSNPPVIVAFSFDVETSKSVIPSNFLLLH